VPITSTFTSGK
jgi:hypothetical protein